MNLTDKQRRVLVDLSDGDWRIMVPHHNASTVQRCYALGLIRCDHDHLRYDERMWTITPRGDELLEKSE